MNRQWVPTNEKDFRFTYHARIIYMKKEHKILWIGTFPDIR